MHIQTGICFENSHLRHYIISYKDSNIGYMALYKRLFVYITRAARRVLYCKQPFIYGHITCQESLSVHNVTIIQWKATLQTCSIIMIYIMIAIKKSMKNLFIKLLLSKKWRKTSVSICLWQSCVRYWFNELYVQFQYFYSKGNWHRDLAVFHKNIITVGKQLWSCDHKSQRTRPK
jgi:hypothetical protein